MQYPKPMRSKYLLIILSIFISRVVAYSQHTYENWIHARVICINNNQSLPHTQVGSYSRNLMFACDSTGEFRAAFPAGDSLKVLALGYTTRIVHIDSLLKQKSDIKIIELHPIHYQLETVDVTPYTEYSEFRDHLVNEREQQKELDKSLQFKQPTDTLAYQYATYRSKPSVLNAIVNPLSFIYYNTSRSERIKVKAQKRMQEDKIRSRLTKELVHRLTQLENEELDIFLIYCNIKISLTEHDNEASISVKVMNLYQQYLKEDNQK